MYEIKSVTHLYEVRETDLYITVYFITRIRVVEYQISHTLSPLVGVISSKSWWCPHDAFTYLSIQVGTNSTLIPVRRTSYTEVLTQDFLSGLNLSVSILHVSGTLFLRSTLLPSLYKNLLTRMTLPVYIFPTRTLAYILSLVLPERSFETLRL